MGEAMIITVGIQASQAIFSIRQKKPEFIGLLGTNTPECRKSIREIEESCPYPPSKCRILNTTDSPGEIGKIVENFKTLYQWLIDEEKIESKDIYVDPSGGRKWMSSGVIMYASFLGLNLIYVDIPYRDGQPDPGRMNVEDMSNAYEQVGFLEEQRADRLFNDRSYAAAAVIYDSLSKKLSMPRVAETKRLLSEGMCFWQQFRFKEAHALLSRALALVKECDQLSQHRGIIEQYIEFLSILRSDEMQTRSLYELLKNKGFAKYLILHLFIVSDKHARAREFDLAVLLNYRILELISQARLAAHGIDTSDVSPEIRETYNEKFREITKIITGSESEIPDKIAFLYGMMLLYCLRDELVEDISRGFRDPGYIKGFRKETEIRNYLWIEHGNRTVTEEEYRRFNDYVKKWLLIYDENIFQDAGRFQFIKFP